MNIEYIETGLLRPYEKNAKKHPEKQVDEIANSIREFGFRQPLVVDRDGVIVIGHGRFMAAKKLGINSVPCIRADDLTPQQIKALRLADNKTNESDWDADLLNIELGDIFDLDMSQFGFEKLNASEFFDRENRSDTDGEEGNEEYNEFLAKFEQPKTTDDCYTPENIYNAVADWVRREYNIPNATFIRPFYPGGDYQKEQYPTGAVVVDNPPFSILAEIIDFYVENGVKFFLFAPAVTILNYVTRTGVCAVCTQSKVTYENGANVATSFITNLGDGTIAAFSAPDLFAAVDEANDENEKAMTKSLPKYEYPTELITSAKLGWLGKYGQRFEIPRVSCAMVRQLDAMKETGQGIFGNGLLLSERAAAERAAAERAAAERAAAERAAATKWQLSEREREIVKSLK